MQRPPTRPNSSRPGFFDMSDTPIEPIGVAPPWMMPARRIGNTDRPGQFGSDLPIYHQNQNSIKTTSKALEVEYQAKSSRLAQSIEDELKSTRLEGPADPLPPLKSLSREMGVLNTLTQRKTAEFHKKTATANAFYGGNPFNRYISEFMVKATKMEKLPGPNGIAMQALNRH